MIEPEQQDELFIRQMASVQTRLRGFLVGVVRSQRDVDDLMQEAALEMWKNRDRYDSQRPFVPWAFGVTSNVLARHRRRLSKEKLVFAEDVVQLLAEAHMNHADVLDVQREKLRDCLDSLPEKDRGLIQERYQRAKSVAVIASDLKSPQKTVYSRLKSIRDRLYKCITLAVQRDGHPTTG